MAGDISFGGWREGLSDMIIPRCSVGAPRQISLCTPILLNRMRDLGQVYGNRRDSRETGQACQQDSSYRRRGTQEAFAGRCDDLARTLAKILVYAQSYLCCERRISHLGRWRMSGTSP